MSLVCVYNQTTSPSWHFGIAFMHTHAFISSDEFQLQPEQQIIENKQLGLSFPATPLDGLAPNLYKQYIYTLHIFMTQSQILIIKFNSIMTL